MASRLALGLYLMGLPPAWSEPAGIPAVIVQPSADSRRELSRVIRSAFGGVPVPLADDALTSSSMLSLEHANPRNAAGQPFNGRELSRPDTFELFKRGSQCVLVRTKDGHVWRLRRVRCAPARSRPPSG
ncbi:MAG: hypothetical protein M3O41_19115 [Pseudomonadota bacterium]|nr:hypothetical protein [Pseudomonadota bacterium]